MPEYLAPGVFVEETSFRHKSIEGVGTSVAGLVGPTRTGPSKGTPEVLTSYAEFTRVYGDDHDLAWNGTSVTHYTAHAARAFFDNGGKQLYVARIVRDDAVCAKRQDSSGVLVFKARFPGEAGNLTLDIRWRDTVNLLERQEPKTALPGCLYLLEADSVKADAFPADYLASEAYPVKLRALVKVTEGATTFTVQGSSFTLRSLADPAPASPLAPGPLTTLDPGELGTHTLTRVYVRKPADADLTVGKAAILTLTKGAFSEEEKATMRALTGSDAWTSLTTLRGALDAQGEVFTLVGDAKLNEGLTTDVRLPLSALAAVAGGTTGAAMLLKSFDIEVRQSAVKLKPAPLDAEVIYLYGDLSTATEGRTSLATAMPEIPSRSQDARSAPVWCSVKSGSTGANILGALYDLFDPTALKGTPQDGVRYCFLLQGGTDGSSPTQEDYAGKVDEIHGSRGLAALEHVEDISIVLTPAAAGDATIHQGVVLEVQKHCQKMRYRVGLVDSRKDMSIGEIREFRDKFSDTRLALYHPWVQIADPADAKKRLAVPPSGFIAGIYARTDVERGVHKSPANEVILGALGLHLNINTFQQELLNPNGINCLRAFSGRGFRVWGGRTLSGDPEWKYVNIRRYFLYLERSIEKSTQWAVFEPNGENLWANIRASVEDFLYAEWKNGRLLGGTPKEAYFVRCDRSTMTQNDLDNGRLVCLVGVAALTPAEFVIFRIGQKTANA